MATLNFAFKELSCKIVYYGCGMCGKTTNLIHIHKTVPQKFRGELVSLATEQDRTLFFDFLPLDLGEVKGFKTKFQLYTVPGQIYYNATRKLVLRGVDGLVFVVDSRRDRLQENIESLENLKQNLAEYGYHLQTSPDDNEGIPWLLQYNMRDMPNVCTREELDAVLNPGWVIVHDAVAVNGIGVKDTLKGISSLVIRKLNAEQATGATAEKPIPTAGTSTTATPARPVSPTPAPAPAPAPVPPPQPAAARPATPPPAPAPAPAKAAPAPVKASAPAAPPAPPPTPLQVNAVGKASLRGLGLGSSTLSLSAVDADNQQFLLSGKISFLGIFGGTVARKLARAGVENRGGQNLLKLTSNDGMKPDYEVFVPEGSSNELYLNYIGSFGQVQVTPPGKSPIA
jgi:signal recognition particle receptor subunit beta